MSTRTSRFIAGLLSGYANVGANIVFTIISIPLALHYLSTEEFGLWVLAVQINGYLGLVDLGMGSAISRFLADHKDDVGSKGYGSHFATGAVVFGVQGLITLLLGGTFSLLAPALFAVPSTLSMRFGELVGLLAMALGLSVGTRSLGSPLWAFQRFDVINGLSCGVLLLSLPMLWWGFARGWGIFAFALTQFAGVVITAGISFAVCWKQGYYPSDRGSLRADKVVFWELFRFGRDSVLVNLGSQLLNASQIIIISRVIGLNAAAIYAVGTKFYNMGLKLVVAPIGSAAPGLTELFVRGEKKRFSQRYWDLIRGSLLAAILLAVPIAVGNKSAISIWTGGTIDWPKGADIAIGVLLVVQVMNGSFIGLFGIIKNWQPVRKLKLVEAVLFLPLAIVLAKPFGIIGIVTASVVVQLTVSTAYAWRSAVCVIGQPREFATDLGWAVLSFGVAATMGLCLPMFIENDYATAVSGAVASSLVLAAIWMFRLSPDSKSQLRGMMAGVLARR
ncbi:polysaccharide biosynthesis protein [Haloferula helveola]|uniref:Polysaccharide biosynthesis protein n=1 Tax=Haloferula helveola TaxID=490095 RepID=A0ABM7RGC2_9BACT|nr:polysaccharide biosynthesis protein [Haloferula helveola]